MSTTQTLLTFEEFEQLPEYVGKQELLQGEVIELPPPEYHHNKIGERTWGRLKAALTTAQAAGLAEDLGEVHHEMGYKLTDRTYLIPDVSITHRGQPVKKYLLGAPALAVEIISPSNRAETMEAKVESYFEDGAREIWVFYPKLRRIAVHFCDTSRVLREDSALETTLLPGFSVKVSELFG